MADSPSELNAAVEKLERKHNENPEGRYFAPLADNYRKLGELETAEQLLREGLRRHPDYLSAHVVLGRCLVDRGALADARTEFVHVLSVDPQNLVALKAMGEIAAGSGERGEAERWYRELLAVDPMNEDARTALASLEEPAAGSELSDAGSDRDDASWESLPALDLDPGLAGAGYDAPDERAEEDAGLGWDGLPTADDSFADAPSGEDAQRDDAGRDESPEDVARSGEDAGWQASRQDGGDAPFEPIDLDLALPDFSASGADADAEEGDAAAASFRLDGLEGSSGFEPAEEEEEEVVTETIAELYAQQGFHDRAAEVYRRLLRERGEDAALRERLEEMERLSRGEAAEPVGAAEPWEGDDAASAAGEEPSLPAFGEAVSSGAAEPWGEAAGREDDGDDPFASSFRYGFAGAPADGAGPATADDRATGGGDGADTADEGADPWLSDGGAFPGGPATAGAGAGFDASGLYDDGGAGDGVGAEDRVGTDGGAGADDEADPAGWAAPDADVAAGSTFGFEPAAEATGGDETAADPWEVGSLEAADDAAPAPAWADAASDVSSGAWGGALGTDAAPHGESPRPASVRAYLSELIAWPAAPSGASPAAEAPITEEPTAEDTAAEETPAAAAGPETEPIPGAPGIGAQHGGAEPVTGEADDLLPWEQPVESDAAPGAAGGGGFSFEDFFDEKTEEPAPAPEAPRAAEKPAPEREPEPSRPEDEEDLESFQAWLRGLRR